MKISNKIISSFLFLIINLAFYSCNGFSSTEGTDQRISYAETVFEVQLLSPLSSDEMLILEILDEVTGVALNPERFKMEISDDGIYTQRLPLAVGSVIRYRYIKTAQSTIIEKDTNGKQVDYRLYQVTDASIVRDTITTWEPDAYSGITGEVSGYIFDEKSNVPLAEIMVGISGMRTFSSHDGFYKFENVPLGEYLITAIHPDGKYDVFQQSAIIAENAITPASFGMKPAKLVEVTFIVTVPEETDSSANIRLIGNTYSLGNSFAELNGGGSVYASRAPVLESTKDGEYEITLQLPAGSDLRYKYTLGNGFINAEHDSENNFLTRQLVVPSKDSTIKDSISTWYSKGAYPVNFEITTPENTPDRDTVSIQLNPYVWLEPFPTWKIGTSQWKYTLYGPFEYLGSAEYRFCRNNQCGTADDEVTRGFNSPGYQLIDAGKNPITIPYPINQWFGLQTAQYNIQPIDFSGTNALFIKGYQLNSDYDPEWLPFLDSSVIDMGVSGANWLFFSPTWTFTEENIFSAGLKSGSDTFSADILRIRDKANDAGLFMALYPQINTVSANESYLSKENLSYTWWQNWFDEYERFILNYGVFSESQGINTLIIGGKSAAPGFPNGKLPNGNFSNTPYDFKDRWAALIDNLRSRFSGQIGIALPSTFEAENLPEFLHQTDFIYVELESALTDSTSPALDELITQAGTILDRDIYKLYATYQKPMVLGVNYYSMDGSASNCASSGNPCATMQNAIIDVDEQADIYQALLKAVITRPWIYGVVSTGLNPAVSVQDSSASVYGKPAFDVLSYYFNQMK